MVQGCSSLGTLGGGWKPASVDCCNRSCTFALDLRQPASRSNRCSGSSTTPKSHDRPRESSVESRPTQWFSRRETRVGSWEGWVLLHSCKPLLKGGLGLHSAQSQRPAGEQQALLPQLSMEGGFRLYKRLCVAECRPCTQGV